MRDRGGNLPPVDASIICGRQVAARGCVDYLRAAGCRPYKLK